MESALKGQSSFMTEPELLGTSCNDNILVGSTVKLMCGPFFYLRPLASKYFLLLNIEISLRSSFERCEKFLPFFFMT